VILPAFLCREENSNPFSEQFLLQLQIPLQLSEVIFLNVTLKDLYVKIKIRGPSFVR
jgi:hypothetical protein